MSGSVAAEFRDLVPEVLNLGDGEAERGHQGSDRVLELVPVGLVVSGLVVGGGGELFEGLDERVVAGYGDTVPMSEAERESLEGEISERRMLDSYGGYVWGDPVVLWSWPRRARFEFSVEQLAVAERVLRGAA